MTQQNQEPATDQGKQSALLKIVREATERFKDVRVAENAGYRSSIWLRER